jgi:hypothetical protein
MQENVNFGLKLNLGDNKLYFRTQKLFILEKITVGIKILTNIKIDKAKTLTLNWMTIFVNLKK